jgi:dihydroxy-acid dehydratase
LVVEGDVINIDIPQRSINIDIDAAELSRRRSAMEAGSSGSAWQPQTRERQVSAALKVYAAMATSADKGAVRNLEKL